MRSALLACVVILAGCTGAAPPTATETASPLPTATEVSSPTPAPTATVSRTRTATKSPTATPSPTPTATASPTVTPSPTPTPTPTPSLEQAVRLAEVDLWRNVKNDSNDSVAYELRVTLVNDAGRDASVTVHPAIRFGADGSHYTDADVDRRTVVVPAGERVLVLWHPRYDEPLANASGEVRVVERAWVG